MIGKTISHYKILEKLGEGGMGVVYKAEDLKLKRTVALKFLPPELTRDPEAKERFIQEAQAASALDHPNICVIHEIDETEDGQMFICMAYYEGETLKKKLASGQLPVDSVIDIAIQIAQGLVKAHEHGIIHRDIKPGNIMITKDDIVKILDFGLAKLVGQVGLTKTGTTVGTIAYMSPEQARGEEVDHRTDIWSLGVVLYEMISGKLPFRGEYEQAIMYSIINEEPEPLKDTEPAVPLELQQIISRALKKDPESRYSSATGMLKDLEKYQISLIRPCTEFSAFKYLLPRLLQPRIAIPMVFMIIALCLIGVWSLNRRANIERAKQELVPEIKRLIEEDRENTIQAFNLAQKAERYIPDDPELIKLWSEISYRISIATEPQGANVYWKEYNAIDNDWEFLGVTPIENIRVPRAFFRWKMEKQGYETVMAVAATYDLDFEKEIYTGKNIIRKLDKKEAILSGMVRVKGTGGLDDFFIDKYEVTNKQYKDFVDAGGYKQKKYWKHKFVKDGKVLTWEQAMAEFVDRSGRPGPATWQAGDYPDGQDDYPVTGISWYEAAAYAKFAGKCLPTMNHWYVATGRDMIVNQMRFAQLFIPLSNFGRDGPIPVGSSQAMNSYGCYDMAGNVREWCWNESQKGRCIRGGAWNDVIYMYADPSQASPFDRSAKNGFRCVQYLDMEKVPQDVLQPFEHSEPRDFYKEKPVSDEIFQVYKNQFLYDRTDLNAVIEERDDVAEDWIKEKITFDAAYSDERIIAYLFLPKNTLPPFQVIIYFPSSAALWSSSSENLDHHSGFKNNLAFIVKTGRAVLFPVYKGTYERRIDIAHWPSEGTHQHTEYRIKLVKDLSRSIDYLESRSDIDRDKLAFYGFSWGPVIGNIILAVEERLKVGIFMVGGLDESSKARPEVDLINYVSRVKTPILMLNGEYDLSFTFEMAVKPLYDLLGTPEKDKLLKVYKTDHFIPLNESIKEILNWLDRYLGPPE